MRQSFAYSSGLRGCLLDLADDARPTPRRLDLVHERSGREFQQPVARAFVLELLVLEALPALERVVVPRASGEVLVEVVVAVREMSSPARSWSRSRSSARRGTARGSGRRGAAYSSGRPHRPRHTARRGHEPVTVAGSIRSLVAVSIGRTPPRRRSVERRMRRRATTSAHRGRARRSRWPLELSPAVHATCSRRGRADPPGDRSDQLVDVFLDRHGALARVSRDEV